MAMDVHLKIDTIDGESKEKGYENQIQCLSWSFGETQEASASHGGGMGAGKVNFNDFHFTMVMCKASPKLFLHCATGQHLANALLTVRKAGQNAQQQKLAEFKFTDLMISSYQTGGSDASTGLPVEAISFNFSKVEFEYFEQDQKGVSKSAGKAGYDLKKNTKV
ncbi:MAG: type VI secretion system tube protein Hcp [Gemmataceae bacterium]